MTAISKRVDGKYDLFKVLVAVVLFVIVLVLLYIEQDETETAGVLPAEQQAPVVGAPVTDADGSFTVSGEGEPGSTIEVLANGEVLGTVEVGADGLWSFSGELEPGVYDLTAQMIDDDGTVVSAAEAVVLDIAEPEVAIALPELDAPEVGADGEFSLSGTAEPGRTIEIRAAEVSLGTVAVGDDGTWAFEGQLEAGDYDVVVQTLDEEGTVINESETTSLSIEAVQVEIAAPVLDPPQLGTDGQLSLSGTGEPGQTVEIRAGDVSLGTTTVEGDGSWTLEGELDSGEYDVTVRTISADGEILNESAAVAITIAEPVAEIAQPGVGSPVFDITGGFSISGTGEPGSTIELWVGGAELGAVTVGDDGVWSYTGELDAGAYDLVARTVDATGAVINESTEIDFEVEKVVTVVDPTLTEPTVSASGTVTVSGTAEPGLTIEIVEDGAVVGTVDVADDGAWSFVYAAAAGEHSLAVQNQGDAEGISASVSFEFTAQAPEPEEEAKKPEESQAIGDQDYFVEPDDWLSKLAREFYGDATKWTLIYEGTNAKAVEDKSYAVIGDPNLLRPGWKLWVPEN